MSAYDEDLYQYVDQINGQVSALDANIGDQSAGAALTVAWSSFLYASTPTCGKSPAGGMQGWQAFYDSIMATLDDEPGSGDGEAARDCADAFLLSLAGHYDAFVAAGGTPSTSRPGGGGPGPTPPPVPPPVAKCPPGQLGVPPACWTPPPQPPPAPPGKCPPGQMGVPPHCIPKPPCPPGVTANWCAPLPPPTPPGPPAPPPDESSAGGALVLVAGLALFFGLLARKRKARAQ